MDLISLWQLYQEQDRNIMIELENHNHIPVGAIKLDEVRIKDLKLSETPTADKYLLIINGIYVFFSYWKKVYGKKVENDPNSNIPKIV